MITYTYLSAFAAFSGSAAGMLTAVVSNWMGERRKHRARGELRVHSHRYKLYKEFIAEGAKLYPMHLCVTTRRFRTSSRSML